VILKLIILILRINIIKISEYNNFNLLIKKIEKNK
jgi:hypothetical protein